MKLNINRRKFLATTSAVAAISFSEAGLALRPALGLSSAPDPQPVKPELSNVKACIFDTFGTVVDWRSSVFAQGQSWGKAKGLNINWMDFTDQWRLGYPTAMNKVRNGQIPWTRLDDLHRMILDELLV